MYVLPSWLLFFHRSHRRVLFFFYSKQPGSEKKNKESKEQTSLIGSNWPSLPVPADSESPDSPIQPGQKSPAPWKVQQRGPDDFERDRVGKYAQYFVGNEILPIPEIVQALEPRILSLVVSDLKTRRLVGLKKRSVRGASEKKQASLANTFAEKVLQLGMSCCPQRRKPLKQPKIILRPDFSDYSRSIKGPVGSALQCATSRLSSLERFWPLT